MAAYASLVSLRNLIDDVQNHPNPPITLDDHHVESLCEKITFLLKFLEDYTNTSEAIKEAADGLESRIADVAYYAEDVIESLIVDRILRESDMSFRGHHNRFDIEQRISHFCDPDEEDIYAMDDNYGARVSLYGECKAFCRAYKEAADELESRRAHVREHAAEIEDFHQINLQEVLSDMAVIVKEAMEIKQKFQNHDEPVNMGLLGDSSRIPPSVGLSNDTMVGFDDLLDEVLDKLTGDESSLQAIPIVGMGGIGKTTLANAAYRNQLVGRHFDVCSWATASQNYDAKEILSKVVDQNTEENSSLEEVGVRVHKRLYGRRYLVIIDDIWSDKLWDEINCFFPDNNNRSRILITTRISTVALRFSNRYITLKLLDDENSWDLLRRNVFGKEVCPIELEECGRDIAKSCNGLPLSIALIGGLLAKSSLTQENWWSISKHLHSSVNLMHEQLCLEILHSSYKHLPLHLRPCFLYMGTFHEDSEIRKSELIRLWVAEGFVKPVPGKSLELAAEEYLMDLVDRNLISVELSESTGKIKCCKVHDLVRDLCIREAEKEEFFCVPKMNDSDMEIGRNAPRRIVFHELATAIINYSDPQQVHDQDLRLFMFFLSAPLVRSLRGFPLGRRLGPRQRFSRLLRVWERTFSEEYEIIQLFNLRFIAFKSIVGCLNPSIPQSIYCFWNLQTLILGDQHYKRKFSFEFWKMYKLKHVQISPHFCLPDCPSSPSGSAAYGDYTNFALENLRTLSYIHNFVCSEEVVQRIPNIRKLKLMFSACEDDGDGEGKLSQYCLNNLHRLQKLESLSCTFSEYQKPYGIHFQHNFTLPHSLVKLSLWWYNYTWKECTQTRPLLWEDITTHVGSLPLLQVLKLHDAVEGCEWNLVEGKFQRLIFLEIKYVKLEYWEAEADHFPRLEHLFLGSLRELTEIPLGIGDAPNLQSITLDCCSESVVDSAQKILDEQEKLGNSGLRVKVQKEGNWDTRCYMELHPIVDEDEDEDEEKIAEPNMLQENREFGEGTSEVRFSAHE